MPVRDFDIFNLTSALRGPVDRPFRDDDILSLCSCDITRPLFAADILALVSGVGVLSNLASDILAFVSGLCLYPCLLANLLAVVSALCIFPVLAEDNLALVDSETLVAPSPPSVIFCSIPVLISLRPYQRINQRSNAHAPIAVRLASTIIMLVLSIGRRSEPLFRLCFAHARLPIPLPI